MLAQQIHRLAIPTSNPPFRHPRFRIPSLSGVTPDSLRTVAFHRSSSSNSTTRSLRVSSPIIYSKASIGHIESKRAHLREQGTTIRDERQGGFYEELISPPSSSTTIISFITSSQTDGSASDEPTCGRQSDLLVKRKRRGSFAKRGEEKQGKHESTSARKASIHSPSSTLLARTSPAIQPNKTQIERREEESGTSSGCDSSRER